MAESKRLTESARLFPKKLRIASKDAIASAIGSVGETVRPRTGPDRRTADDRDWWCFRRWLFTLGCNNLLFYPFIVTRPAQGGPDFLMHYGDGDRAGACGLEMTEATNTEDAKERTLSELHAKGPYLMGDFGGRSYTATSEEALRDDYIKQIVDGLERKLAKAPAYFDRCALLDVMIYVNNNAGTFVSLESVATELHSIFVKHVADAGIPQKVGRITVLDHTETLICVDDDFRMYRTIEGITQ
jgi:hypothetical protein